MWIVSFPPFLDRISKASPKVLNQKGLMISCESGTAVLMSQALSVFTHFS